MTSSEIHRSETIEAYKHSIMERYELAQAKSKGANCHDAAYYLLRIEPQEYGSDGVCYVDFSYFEPIHDLYQAVLIAFGDVNENKVNAIHLATLHPYDKTKVIHRDIRDYWPPDRPHNVMWSIFDFIEALSVGSANPMRIEFLEDVQKRWNFVPMHLFSFKSEYFEKMLSSHK